MTSGWSLWITILVVANIAGALWLLWANTRNVGQQAGDDTTGHRWDVDLEELNNPLPRWWLWLFMLSIVFAIGYLVLYPGLGAFRGSLGWSERGQYADEVRQAAEAAKPRFQRYAALDLPALSRDPEAMAMARNIFVNTCAGCHGSDARGATGFPNLTDGDWLYGNAPAQLIQTITEGRLGVMPPWGAVVGDDGVRQLTAYVLTLSGRGDANGADAKAGAEKFAAFCVACHGADGRGNQALGAANLTDDIWLFGGDEATIRQTIAQGRTGQMPPHGVLLGPDRVRLLAAYVLSLSPQSATNAAASDTAARTE